MFNDKMYSEKMNKTFEVFIKELTSLRTGRANASMLDFLIAASINVKLFKSQT